MFKSGDRIKVTNERPAKDWVRADSAEATEAAPKAKHVAPVVPSGRRADSSVGG
jgi:hypothetical protein